MAETTEISWADATFNPWEGCTQISPGCARCYAKTRNQRFSAGSNWGPGAPRRRTSAAQWLLPIRWNNAAARGEFGQCWNCGDRAFIPRAGKPCRDCDAVNTYHYADRETGAAIRPRVFCASLADWLDDEVPIAWIADLLQLIHDTPNLDWLLLTKRPENFEDRLWKAMLQAEKADITDPEPYRDGTLCRWLEDWHMHGDAPENVWIGTTVEDQTRAEQRIPALLQIPARIRFLSCEPLLERVDLRRLKPANPNAPCIIDALAGETVWPDCDVEIHARVDWVICGGESGPGARAMDDQWARKLLVQCLISETPFFMKQLGGPRDKRGHLTDLPEDLRLRQFPKVAARPPVRIQTPARSA